jgi:folate-binding Fe-S cluster repair protein YgfZ
MLNLQALDGISFNKGCYMGQETVARAKYRGANNRALFVLSGTAATQVASGDTLEIQLGDNWRRSGLVLNAWQQGRGVAHRRAAQGHRGRRPLPPQAGRGLQPESAALPMR